MTLFAKTTTAMEPESPGWRARLGAWTPFLVIAPSLAGELRLCLRLHAAGRSISRCPTRRCCRATASSASGPTSISGPTSAGRSLTAICSSSADSTSFWRLLVGLALAIAIDQRVRGEALWRTIFLYPLAVSFVVTGAVWRWIYSPDVGIEHFVRGFGWTRFHFPPDHRPRSRDLRHHRHRRLAILGIRDGAVSRGAALGRSRSRQGRPDRRGEPLAHLSQDHPALDRADLRGGRRWCCCNSRSRPSISSSR